MVIKTFNVSEETYAEFSKYCKELGMSMSKQVDMFMKSQVAEEPTVRADYLRKLNGISKGKFIKLQGSLKDHLENV